MLFQKLPDELFVKILVGVRIANFASSCSDISHRVFRLSSSFPFKMKVHHDYFPAIERISNYMTSYRLMDMITVYAAGTQYQVSLGHAINFLHRYFLIQKAAKMALTHRSVLHQIKQVGHCTALYVVYPGAWFEKVLTSHCSCRDVTVVPG